MSIAMKGCCIFVTKNGH